MTPAAWPTPSCWPTSASIAPLPSLPEPWPGSPATASPSGASWPTMARPIARDISPTPSPQPACATFEPGPKCRAPTARPNASSSPARANGPTPDLSTPLPRGRRHAALEQSIQSLPARLTLDAEPPHQPHRQGTTSLAMRASLDRGRSPAALDTPQQKTAGREDVRPLLRFVTGRYLHAT
jgi:hypothetical protein